MAVVFGAIADDFTGATDLAALLARSGHAVNLRLGVPQGPPDGSAAFEVIALKCRTAPADVAVSQALQAFEWLQRAGASHFYWKYCSTFDSTAQGNIGPVAEALMDALGASQTIYCPAFPENGRSIFMGNLFVGEQLLSESPMKDHPLTPMRDANLVRLLAPQVKRKVGLANRLCVAKGAETLNCRLAELEAQAFAHVIIDAVADEDLATIAEATFHMPLITGGSALAMPLPSLMKRAGLLTPVTQGQVHPVTGSNMIVLAGSCSAMTRKQVAHYRDKAACLQLDPARLAAEGVEPAIAWLRANAAESRKMIYATAEPSEVQKAQSELGVEQAGSLVEQALARLATEALALGVRRFVVAGGETSGAVVQALGAERLTIGPEIAPGVPWTFGSSNGETVALTLKSGNFGSESFFDDARIILEEL